MTPRPHRPSPGPWPDRENARAGTPGDRTIRASDADRERIVDELRDHCEAGRLDANELDQRLEAAFSARTMGDLDPVVADLPGHSPPPGRVRRHGGPLGWGRLPILIAVLLVLSVISGHPVIWLAGPILLFTVLRRAAGGRRYRSAGAPMRSRAGRRASHA